MRQSLRQLRGVAAGLLISTFASTFAAAGWHCFAEDDFRLDGHESQVEAVCFSPDGKFVASGSQDKTARLWNLAEKKATVFKCEGRGTAFSVAFSPDGKWLSSGDFVLSVKLWSLPSGSEAANFEGDRTQGHVAKRVVFSPNSELLVAGFNGGEVRVWDIATKTPGKPFPHQGAEIQALSFSPDGKKLAVGAAQRFKLYDVATRAEVVNILTVNAMKDLRVSALAWTSDGKTLVSGDFDGFLRLWDAETGKKKSELKFQASVIESLALSPDNATLATPWHDWDVAFVDLATLKIVKTMPGFEEEPHSVAYSPDGQWLAASAHNYIRVFNVSLAKPYVAK